MIGDILLLAWLLLTLFCALAIQAREDRLRNIEAARDLLLLALADATEERDEAVRQCQWRETQIAGHIRDWELLSLAGEMERDEEAEDVISQVEAYLEAL